MLSVNIDKNQSTKVCGALYIPTYENKFKIITDMIQYYKNITSMIGANVRIQRIYKYKKYRKYSRVTKEKLKKRAEGPEIRTLWMVYRRSCFHCTTLVYNRENP